LRKIVSDNNEPFLLQMVMPFIMLLKRDSVAHNFRFHFIKVLEPQEELSRATDRIIADTKGFE